LTDLISYMMHGLNKSVKTHLCSLWEMVLLS